LTAVSDQELVARAQQRDEDSIAALYDKYYDRIYRFALARIGNPADAEDLTQETFLHMVAKINTFRWQGVNFTAWLFRIAHNAVIDSVRRRSSRGQQVPIEDVPLVTKDDPEAEVVEALSYKEILGALKRLTLAQQEVIALRFAADLTVSETAKALGKAEGTIKATQFQAFQALRHVLQVENQA
jgi:RNA polymerase sigma-70 factor (ECF subfamily)